MKSTIIKIRPSEMEVHPGTGAQRAEGVDERRAARMAANFKPHALHVFSAVKRGAKYLVIDGAHRLRACEIAGYNEPVDVRVISDATEQQEAESFVLVNDFKSPSAISRFISRVSSGDPVALEVDEIIRSHGWTVTPISNEGAFRCITAAETQVHRRGNLDRTLRVLTAAYGHSEEGVHQNLVVGVSTLLYRLGEHVNDAILVATLKANDPVSLLRMARGANEMLGGSVPSAVARVLVGKYNKGRRSNQLPEWVWTR